MKNITRIITTGIVVVIVALAVWGWLALSHGVPEGAEGPWGGVDVTVIEKYAIDAGREVGSLSSILTRVTCCSLFSPWVGLWVDLSPATTGEDL